MFKKLRIAAKLIIVSAIILVIPLGLIGYFSISKAKAGLIDLEHEQLRSRTEEIAEGIDNVFEVEKKVTMSLANERLVIDALTALDRGGTAAAGEALTDLSEELQRFKATPGLGDAYQVIVVMDNSGKVAAASDSSYLGVSIAERRYLQDALKGMVNLGEAGLNKVTGEPFIPIASPVYSEGSKIVGAVATILDLTFLNKLILNAKIGETGYAFVISDDGTTLAHPDETIIFKLNVNELAGMERIASRMMAGEDGIEEYVYNGVAKTAGFHPVAATGWSVNLALPDSEFLAPVNAVRNYILIIAGVSFIVAMLIFVLFARSITKPIKQGVRFANEIASGDLTATIEIKNKDEIGELADAMKTMIENLLRIVTDVMSASEQVSSGSQQMSSTAEQLSGGATEQAASVEQVSASMEEMNSNISQNADNAFETEKIAQKAAEDAETSGKAVLESVEAMKQIADKITIIEDIARQTNMLSLNASIEAARAGEQGKGFAVVAAEVGKLAARSKEAAAEISELSASTVEVSETAREMLTQLVPDIKRTAELVQEISAASREQSSGAEQINGAVTQLDSVVQQNASASEEMASVAEELAAQSEELLNTIAFFNVNGGGTGHKKIGSKEQRQIARTESTKAEHKQETGITPVGQAASKTKAVPAGAAAAADSLDMEDFEEF